MGFIILLNKKEFLIDSTINILEIENGITNDFNYYGIEIKMENGVEVLNS